MPGNGYQEDKFGPATVSYPISLSSISAVHFLGELSMCIKKPMRIVHQIEH